MTADVFAEWLRRQGYTIKRTENSYWYNEGPRTYQAFPYHWLVDPSPSELRDFMGREHVAALRYSTPVSASEGMVSYHAVCNTANYDLDTLSSNSRSKVRRGLKNCDIQPIRMDTLAKEGWNLQANTQERQGRHGAVDQETWRRLCLSASNLPGFEAWGAFVEGNLAASLLIACVGDVCYLLYPQSHQDYFRLYVNNALVFTVTRELLARPAIHELFYGLHSLDAPPSVDDFKFSMGYVAKPVRQRVMFHPWLRPFMNNFSHQMLQTLRRTYPGSRLLAKGEGMVRFYRQGKQGSTVADQSAFPSAPLP